MISRCRYHARRRSAAGYSLAEVLVVLAILALLVAVVPIGVSRLLPGIQLNAAAGTLADELRTARARAVETSVASGYGVQGNSLTAIGEAEPVDLDGVTAIEYFAPDPSGRMTRQATLRFLPDGSSTGGHFLLTAENRERRVAVHWLFGHVEVRRGEDAS